MPFLRIWIHLVWATEARRQTLTMPGRTALFLHMKENTESKGIYLSDVNGHLDHVHCLVGLGPGQNIDKVVQLLKGEASFWANKNDLFEEKIFWQRDYFAVSVSESAVEKVRTYIWNQEEHHRVKSFQDEYDDFIRLYKFEKARDGKILG